MTQAINQLLADGYRDIFLVPVIYPAGFSYLPAKYTVFARHFTKDSIFVGQRYEVGEVIGGIFYENIPF